MIQMFTLFTVLSLLSFSLVVCETPHHIVIDGNFDDWKKVTLFPDPMDQATGPVVLQDQVPDCHGTNDGTRCDVPPHVFNTIIDIVEYGFTHDPDGNWLYAYFRSVGDMSKTSNSVSDGEAGRSYLEVSIDVDDNLATGYCSNLGGYYPESCGYDIAFELEMYNGSFNSAHYILHSMSQDNTTQYNKAIQDQKNGIVQFGPPANGPPGGYHPYTEWVYWLPGVRLNQSEINRCPDGPWVLPDNATICFVEDKVDGPFLGSMKYAFSQNGTQLEMAAPVQGFLKKPDGTPIIQFKQKITPVFDLETSEQYSTPRQWASDSTWPIRGYYTAPPEICIEREL